MAIHNIQHDLNSIDNHSAGTSPAADQHNLVGTSSAGAIEEVLVEAPGASTASAVVRRAADNQIQVPSSGQTANEAIGKGQVESLIADSVWQNFVHSVVADNTAATVGDTIATGNQTTDRALIVGDRCVNTTDKKLYTVTSVAGGTTGDLVTWDAGVAVTVVTARIDESNDHLWIYDVDGDAWIDRGTTDHVRSHAITSTSDHTANNWKLPHSNGSGEITELSLGAENAPLLGGGAAAAPKFGAMLIAPDEIACAGATPVDTDVDT